MKQDPLALAFFGAALAVLAGLLLYVFVFKTPDPVRADSVDSAGIPARAFAFLQALIREKFAEKPVAQPAPPPVQAAKPAPAPKPAAPAVKYVAAPVQAGTGAAFQVYPPRSGMSWTYRVSLEPQLWQDAVLVYRVTQQGGALVVDTDFRHAKGKMAFRLGSYRAGDPAHANTRFPGFFLYPAYFGDKIQLGQTLAAEWPWQLPGGGVKPGRIKRFEGKVVKSEQYSGPVFEMATMLRIEGRLYYLDEGAVQAVARETLWYAPKAAQLVRIEREGRTPDESATRIVAELVEMR